MKNRIMQAILFYTLTAICSFSQDLDQKSSKRLWRELNESLETGDSIEKNKDIYEVEDKVQTGQAAIQKKEESPQFQQNKESNILTRKRSR